MPVRGAGDNGTMSASHRVSSGPPLARRLRYASAFVPHETARGTRRVITRRLRRLVRAVARRATVALHRRLRGSVPDFDRDRMEALVLYIASATKDDKNFGRTKLAKVLFYSDFGAFRDDGKPLTGATYERWQFGPFPRELPRIERELQRAGLVDLAYDVPDAEEKKIVPTGSPPDVHSVFEPWQITLVDMYIQQFREQTAREVSDESHQHLGWRMAEERQTIPYEAAFLPEGPPRRDQVARAKEIAREQGWFTREGWIWERDSA
jgi:hypothetical protein